jgi:ATP-dependent DNA helicase DinG
MLRRAGAPAAQAADIVVVNHHLLLADLALKQEGFGEILPGAQAFVVDEAHQLPDLAAQFFGEGVGARPLVELARDAIAECKDVSARSRRCRAGAAARACHARAARGDGSACRARHAQARAAGRAVRERATR